ncbi:MAG TPA: CHAP domain-containing protein, partial [Solirubrobacterales bacterium]|nr:CHAP domain-containing protein [Solirubrobacterales bacterium]
MKVALLHLAGFGLLLCAAPSAGATERVGLAASSNAGDNDVIATVTVATPPDRRCHGRVRHAGLAARLPTLTTDGAGGGRWQWRVATGVPAGIWHVSVSCQLAVDKMVKRSAFRAAHGPRGQDGARRLVALGSMQAEGWHSEEVGSPTGGIGGGGENGYPEGQCTWWAKHMRPDLPLFPGTSGDADHWAQSARRAGLQVGSQAKPGAIVVFQPGQEGAGEHGHVAYVQSVNGALMTISEANYLNRPPGSTRTLHWPGRHFQFIYKSKTKPIDLGPPPPNTFRFEVFRTCLNGHCGLKRRQGPGTSFPTLGIPLPDGT